MTARAARRRWLAPEVVQTSAMDCGPAALKCLLEGHGVRVSYGRLREACQTEIDGTSIDVLEEVAAELGLEVEQVMLPPGHLLVPEAGTLPALLVVRLPTGFTHFVVLWRAWRGWVQVMDPASGRRWLRRERLLDEVYLHTLAVPADAWREWATSAEYRATLGGRLRRLGVADGGSLLDEAAAAGGWQALAALEAAVQVAEGLARAGALRPGKTASALLRSLWQRALVDPTTLPAAAWPVAAHGGSEPGEEPTLAFRGAVLIRVLGRRADRSDDPEQRGAAAGNPELAAALAEAAPTPLRDFVRLMRGDGALRTGVLLGAAAAGATTILLEALLLRGAMNLGQSLGIVEQRLQAVGFFLILVLAILLVEAGVGHRLARLGRRAEIRLRAAFLEKMPRLPDRYFQSRPVSDLAERSHALHHLRLMPRAGGHIVRVLVQMVVVAAGIVWLYPQSAAIGVAAAAAALTVPLLMLPALQEQDLRVRIHNGALGRFYLDALLGVSAVRAHGGAGAVSREHEALLVEWARAGRNRVRTVGTFEVLQALVGVPFAIWLLARQAAFGPTAGDILLLAYWALLLPALGAELVHWVRQYPVFRNVALRAMEPLHAPEAPAKRGDAAAQPTAGAVRIRFDDVAVRAGGHTILEDVDLEIEPGSHVAIVGASGAGKSSLVGLLLGLHRAAQGRVLADGAELDADGLAALRERTAWLDPAVQIWNRSLFDNLVYGAHRLPGAGLGEILRRAGLRGVVERLPGGLQAGLGENGGCLSGGEGQRVRLGRAMSRWTAGLVVLDEPFRGLDREQRREMLGHARQIWRQATLLCVSHDIAATTDFDRVLVVADGRVVADGPPSILARDPGSPYTRLLAAEAEAWNAAWANPVWRRLRLEAGRLGGEARARVPAARTSGAGP